MAVGRLFYEIAGDTSKLNASLQASMKSLEGFNIQATRAGQAAISKFDEALNPTKKLGERIELLSKAGKSQADIMKVMGNEIEQASKQAKAMGQPIDDLVKKYTSLESKLKSTGESLMKVGRSMSMYLTAPLLAAGAGFIKVGDDFDKGMNKIRIGTGATGEALDALGKDMRALVGRVPQDISEISTAIADLNTRLDLSGKPLQDMAYQMLNLARIGGTQVNQVIQTATRTFGQFSVAAENQADALDYLFKISQQTGIGITNLLSNLTTYGAQLKSVGFDLAQSAALLGMWEKAGINAEAALSGLSMGLGKFAQAGKDPAEALQELSRRIQAAGSDAEGMALAIEAFGTRSGAVLGRAMIEGRLNIEKLSESLEVSTETINKATQESLTLGDRMAMLKNRIEEALEPIGVKLLEALERLIPKIEAALNWIADLAKAFSAMPSSAQIAVMAIAGIMASLGPLAIGVGLVANGIAGLLPLLGGTVGLSAVVAGLPMALAAVGAAFAAWKLVDLCQNLDKTIDRVAKFKIVTSENVDAARQYEAELAEFGIVLEKTNQGYEEYANRLFDIKQRLDEGKDSLKDLGGTMEGEGFNAIVKLNSATKEAVEVNEKYTYTSGLLDKALEKTGQAAAKTQSWLASSLPTLTEGLNSMNEAAVKGMESLARSMRGTEDAETIMARILANAREEQNKTATSYQKMADDIVKAGSEIAEKNDTYWRRMQEIASQPTSQISQQISTIWTDLSRDLTDNILEWKGWADSILGILKDFARAALRTLMESLFSPLQNLLSGFMNRLTGLLSGSRAGGKATAGALGGLAGFAGILPGIGAGGALAGILSGNVYGRVAGGVGAGLLGMAGYASLATGAPLTSMLGAMFTNPWTAVIGGGALGITALVKAILGKSTEQAGAMEVARDLGVNMGKDLFKAFYTGLGLSGAESYGIRKDLIISPKFLTEIAAPLAEAQGTMGEFLSGLETVKTSWGTFSFREAFELGQATGDWTALNEQFKAVFSSSEALAASLPDWQTLLVAGAGDAKTATDALIESIAGLRDSIQGSITPIETMYEKFLKTGEITEEFANQIVSLGGDLAAFENLSGLLKINRDFEEMVEHFRETDEILPGLRQMFIDFGGDLQILDEAAALPGLRSSLGFINSLTSGLKSLVPELDPIRQLLSGQVGPEAYSALVEAGLDPRRFKKLTGLIKMETGWEEAVRAFQSTGRLPTLLREAIGQYGGTAGQLALQRLDQGFNTITEGLLASVKAAMDIDYQREVKALLDYIGTKQQETSDKITTLTEAVNNQFDIVGGNITDAIDAAKTDVVDVLNKILVALTSVPEAQAGGRVERSGLAIIHRNELIIPQGQATSAMPAGTQIIIQGPIYGWNDFVLKVYEAGVDLKRRGNLAISSAY